MSIRILVNYGSEGWKFEDEIFSSVDGAVKQAFANNRCCPFLIVDVIEWEAKASN